MKTFRIYIQTLLIAVLAFIPILGQASPAHAAPTRETFTATPEGANWTVPAGIYNATYLVIGGGGGGGGYGGGGAGGFRTGDLTGLTPGSNVTLVVGTGGAGSNDLVHTARGINGTISIFGSISSAGGGGGGAYSATLDKGLDGGSGGGGGIGESPFNGAIGGIGNTPVTSPIQGYNGATCFNGASAGAGGGGASSTGGTGSLNVGGNGGTGTASAISGSSLFYSAGGGGLGATTGGTGGSSIGGNGSSGAGNASAPTANRGSGGGGGHSATDGSAGVIIIWYDSYPPVSVTTNPVSDLAATTLTANGNITSLNGGGNASIRGFAYKTGTTGDPTIADNEVHDDGSYGIGNYTKAVTGLTAATDYRFRAYVVGLNGIGYGTTTQTQTLDDTPTLTVGAASLITSTGATLAGTLTWAGASHVDTRGFDWDVDTGAPYANTWTETGSYTAEAFTHAILSLSPGTKYFFRAQATNPAHTGYSTEATFLTLPYLPSALTSIKGTTEITLTWSKGSGAGKTMVRRSTTTFPTTTATGDEVYFDTGTTYTDSGLTDGTTYYYSAWSEITTGGLTQYSSSYTTTSQTPGTGTIANPDTLEITSASVFTNFRASGDQLYILTYKCIYTAGDPAYTASDFFNIQLLDGDTLKAQVKMPYWGYRASSIYLAPGSGLVWGSTYKLKILGTASQWTVQPSSSYSLQSYDWKGADMTQLDSFVITSAQSIATYYVTTYTQSVPGYGTIFNEVGGTAFDLAIPGLSVYRPLLFETGVVPIDVSSTTATDVYGATRSLTTSFGAEAAGQIATFSAFFGQTSQTVAGWIVVLFAMLLAAIVGMSANNMGVGAFAGLFIIIAGVILGAPAMGAVWAVGSVFVVLFFFSVARGV